jgi:hypothetical protein
MPYVLSPLQVWIGSHLYPRLAPWALILRRFAAVSRLSSGLRTYSRVVTPTRLALGERVTLAGQLAGTALLRPMAMAPTAAVLF